MNLRYIVHATKIFIGNILIDARKKNHKTISVKSTLDAFYFFDVGYKLESVE